MAERQDAEVEEAGQVYLLMKKEYRISRNVRLAWFLSHLNQVISTTPKDKLINSVNELDILSILPNGWQPEDSPAEQSYLLVPSTQVTFLARRYRFIIELDLSPSTGIVDDITGQMIFDEVFQTLSHCLHGLAKAFKVPGTELMFQPEIFVTILAYSSIIGLQSHQVLVQGCQLDKVNLDDFLDHIYQQLRTEENNIAEILQQQHKARELHNTSTVCCGVPNEVSEDQHQRKIGVSMITADIGLVSMVRQGILALQLLPPNSSAGIIIITDGVTSVPDIAVCEALLNQLRSGTVACSFLQVGGAYSYDCSFGHVPNVELMKFISVATFGSYIPSCPKVSDTCQEMNIYHKAFLMYTFLKTGESMNPEYYCVSQHKLFNEHLVSASGNPALAMRRKKHTEKEVHAHLISVVSVRLREGYTIRDISLIKGGTQLEVKLVLLWKHNMRIEYVAIAHWPLDPSKRTTWVEVTMEGSYDILHDISCTMRKPITSPYRTSVIRRFWNTLQSINQTDQMLVHLQSFNSIPEHFTIPESTKNGVPLFYIPPGSTTPVLSLQHSGTKDSSHSQFSSYWKPVLSMDANFWQRWLHIHRIVIILEHDIPVPKHLHTPGNNGHYSTIQCRISHSALTSLLRDWSSFVLVEGYSYIKLIYSASDHPPTSFYLVRLISKAPCMVLRLGFPIGTPALLRNKIVDELRERILQLRFPQRVQSKEATPKVKRKILGNTSPSKSPPLSQSQPALSDRPCVVVLHKPLEKLLIRYEKLPSDYRISFILNMESLAHTSAVPAPLTFAAGRTASSTLASLSRYFFHQRWIWTVHSGVGPPLPLPAVAQILSVLSEIRVSEGFHFAASGDGIVNMVTELPMKCVSQNGNGNVEIHTCIVQYVLFPPHSTSSKDSFSTDDDNDTEVEAIEVDTELNLVTECWVEPQSGLVFSSLNSHSHLQGLSYQEIPKAIFPYDLTCISTILTFEYLSQLCQNKDHISPIGGIKEEGGDMRSSDCIQTVPFQFDLIKLLPKCQQIEVFFLTLGRVEEYDMSQDLSALPNELLLSLFHGSLQQDLNDREIPLADADHIAFMQQVLQRDRDGHIAPFVLPAVNEECLNSGKSLERQDTVMSFRTVGSNKEVTGSTSTLQSFGNAEMADEDFAQPNGEIYFPRWKCYAKYVNTQQIFLTFLPASFADILSLASTGPDRKKQQEMDELLEENCNRQNQNPNNFHEQLNETLLTEEQQIIGVANGTEKANGIEESASFVSLSSLNNDKDNGQMKNENGTTVKVGNSKESIQFAEPQKRDMHITFSRQGSQLEGNDQNKPRCPVYIYNCSLDLLREQLVNPRVEKHRDIYFRSMYQERSTSTSWTDLLAHSHKYKVLTNYCSLLQEHYHQSYVKGVYRSLQQSYHISSQDILTAMDYCEESLKEIEITTFLQTLCGHIKIFKESFDHPVVSLDEIPPITKTTFTVGVNEPDEEGSDRGPLVSTSSVETEDVSEAESRGRLSNPASPLISEVQETHRRYPEFPLSLLHTNQKCELYPDLHQIIQDKFQEIGAQYFKIVPSNPHYFFYCPTSQKKEDGVDRGEVHRRPSDEMEVSEAELATEDENVSGCCIVTESDTDLEVEYLERLDRELPGNSSLSDSNTVNQDEDSFSILEGDSFLEPEEPQHELPPLFVHLTCSINVKNCHGSMPMQTLPTCLGEVITCLENAESIQSVDLNDLSVTLDIFVLTLPLEIEMISADTHHKRYTSESSVSLNRSPAQPSSYLSDEELMQNMDRLPSEGEDRVIGGDPFSKLPIPHKQAVLATMDEIRWVLEDEIVSAMRHLRVINKLILQKVADHVYNSQERENCRFEVIPLQFVFGPDQSLAKFKEEFSRMSLSGYLLNEESDSFYYVSVSRLYAQRLENAKSVVDNKPVNSGYHLEDCTIKSQQVVRSLGFNKMVGTSQQNNQSPSALEETKLTNNLEQDKVQNSLVSATEKTTASEFSSVVTESLDCGNISQKESKSVISKDDKVEKTDLYNTTASSQLNTFLDQEWNEECLKSEINQSTPGLMHLSSNIEKEVTCTPPPKTPSTTSLADSVQSTAQFSGKLRPSRVQSVVSSQGSLDSDMLGYDGGSSDSECEGTTMNEQDQHYPLMPNFWLIVKIHQDRVEVYSHCRSLKIARVDVLNVIDEGTKEEDEVPEYLQLHQMIVKRIGEICRIVNQTLLLQDLHDSHICNSLLVAESEEDIWKTDLQYTSYRQRSATTDDYSADESYQPRDYLAATMQFIPGHFACDVVWSTIIHIHPRLKMGPNMGVSRAIQALRSVLNAFSVVNRKNMFVYQERSTKSVFYLRLSETAHNGKFSEYDGTLLQPVRSLGLIRSQEPFASEDVLGSRSSLDVISYRGVEGSRPVGQMDKHILLMVHGVGQAGPEITDELVKVLRKRLDEATLDIITVMLVRNCKLTPADVEFIQPPGSQATEVIEFSLPQYSQHWLHAFGYYLRQNLLIFLHVPKYTDSNVEHHFKHTFYQNCGQSDSDLYLYNKPGGQGTGGKGIACIALSFVDGKGSPLQFSGHELQTSLKGSVSRIVLQESEFEALTDITRINLENMEISPWVHVRFDIWEQGNVSPVQLADKLKNALRHALCDVIMEFKVLSNPLCVESTMTDSDQKEYSAGLPTQLFCDVKDLPKQLSNSGSAKRCPSPILFSTAPPPTSAGAVTPESTTPTGKTARRSFWDMLSKPDLSELGSPKTTDDIILEKVEDSRTRRRHKTENVKQPWSQEKVAVSEIEQAQKQAAAQRKHIVHLEEGETGTLHPVFQSTCQKWLAFMDHIGCPSVQKCSAEIVSQFLLPSILTEVVNLVSSLAIDTTVKVFERICSTSGETFLPLSLNQHSSKPPAVARQFILIGRNFQQWRQSTEQEDYCAEESAPLVNRFTPHKGFQRFESLEQSESGSSAVSGKGTVPRQRFTIVVVLEKKLNLYTYNWSVDLGVSLSRGLTRLVHWQNARSHIVQCLLTQKMGLFHHYCFSDTPTHEDLKQEPNHFLSTTLEADALLRSATPPPTKDQGKLSGSGRSLPSLHFSTELVSFDEALRDIAVGWPIMAIQDICGNADPVFRHGAQLLEIKAIERREMEKQLKIENLFVTWQQRSAQSNMPISAADLDTLKQSSRLVHYCATPLLFDPVFRKQIQEDQTINPFAKKRHCSNDSTASSRDRTNSCDSVEMLPCRLKEEPWLLDISNTFVQQYVQYLQSMGFILVQVRPPSPARSIARARAAAFCGMNTDSRSSFSYNKQKSEESPKSTASGTSPYHLQRALPGGIVLMELAFQGSYFCVKQYALECSRIPMGQSVNSQGKLISNPRSKSYSEATSLSESALSMLFTEECDKVRDLMHVHSFSYDFHLRIVHQYLLGCQMTLRQGYQLSSFLEDFIAYHPDIPKFGRNHVFQGTFSISTGMITAHQLYNYITDHAVTYGMKPLRMSKSTESSNSRKGVPNSELPEYALVALWNSSGSYKDSEGLRHHDDFDVSLLVCHACAPFEEQSEVERNLLRLTYYVIMTSQRELFPRLTADMRRFKKLPSIQREPLDPDSKSCRERSEAVVVQDEELDLWEKLEDYSSEFYSSRPQVKMAPGLIYSSPQFPLLASEVTSAQERILSSVQKAKEHCRRDNLWRRLFHGEQLSSDKLKLSKLTFTELEELLNAVQSCVIGEIDPQLDCFLTMNPGWYQSLIKVLLSRFAQSCRHFVDNDNGIQYLVVLNQKFTDCFVIVFLDSQTGKASLKVVFREPLPLQPQTSNSPSPQLVSMYHHLESVINAACFNLWTGLL
ncbi:KICSTOR complex protein SZT2 isoform X2 [Erpetoichthys calabaricus]|uniref:KICSTOR complex protein SZT2 isoform X2 n=1 Tax=Erpetoichthys calabaricus TaxID=27687 RepID=UPI002234C496|nr:KICSTOR complex protein SZT2 isoform X2 [Erpetoichthys calabaricus]